MENKNNKDIENVEKQQKYLMFKFNTEYGNLSTEILRLKRVCKKAQKDLKVLQVKVLELNESKYKRKKLSNTPTDYQNYESSEESDGQFDQEDETFDEIEEISDDNEGINDEIKDIDLKKICENIEKKLEQLEEIFEEHLNAELCYKEMLTFTYGFKNIYGEG